MTNTLVKHSQRSVRKACKRCGKGGQNDVPANALYWAHDESRVHAEDCKECGDREGRRINGQFVLVDREGHRHVCGETPVTKEDIVRPITRQDVDLPAPVKPTDVFPVQKEVSPVVTTPVATATPDVQVALQTLMGALSPKVDRADIEQMVKEAVANVVFPTRTVVERANGEVKEFSGATHHKLADVVTCLLAEEHVLMVGPAGTGKSTIAEQAAEALGLDCYSISLSPQTPASQLVGYMQATGEYVPSLFRKAYETGGVFHFDEMDNGHPSVLAVINAALANGHMAFPDQMVKRHPDFRAIASANTYGRGANRAYVGRQALDAATLDRFTIETIEVDESLENELCHSVGLETDLVQRVLTFVRKVRANVQHHNLPIVISPRASMGMVKLLKAGKSWEAAVESRVRRGLGDTEWNKISK